MIDNLLTYLDYVEILSGFNFNSSDPVEDDTAIVTNLIRSTSLFFNKYTNRKLKARTYSDASTIDKTVTITCLADIDGSLSGLYFLIQNTLGNYYVWFNIVGGSSVDPAVQNAVGIRVDITLNSDANTVATYLKNTFLLIGGWNVSSFQNVVTFITQTNVNFIDANTGFTFETVIAGQEFDPDCFFDSFGGRNLYLPNYPINSITSLYIDSNRTFGSDTLVDSSRYTFYPETGQIALYDDRFPVGHRMVKVIYNGGYNPVPDDLMISCAMAIEYQYKLFVEHRIGQNMSSLQHMSIRFDEKTALPEACTDILEKYVRIIL